MITQTPFRIVDIAHLATEADDPALHRLIAIYETQSDYGIIGRPFEPTGTTEVLVATYDHAPSLGQVEAALQGVRERPDDEMLRLRYRFVRADILRGDALSPGEKRRVTDVLREQDADPVVDLPEASGQGATVIYPARWAPNSYAAALVAAAERVAPPDRGERA